MDNLVATKLALICCDQGVEPDVMEVLAAHGLNHYTSWTDCRGSGETGIRQGNPVWPGLNTVIMIVMDADAVQPLVDDLHKVRDSFPMTPGLKVIVTDGIIM